MSAAPTLFHREYEAELDAWLQQRFGYLCVTFAAIEVVWAAWALLWLIIGHNQLGTDVRSWWVSLLTALVGMGLVSAAQLAGMRRLRTRQELLRATSWLVFSLGVLAIAESAIVRLWTGSDTVWVLWQFFIWHFAACLVLPWQPKESLRALVPLLAVWAIDYLASRRGDPILGSGLAVLASPTILLPGMLVSAARLQLHGQRFRTEMIGKHFRSMRRELVQARALHESLFPKPQDDGFVRLQYSYIPARDVGGDFIHFVVGPTGIAALVLMDVTGHGIAAAMTVNRLYGELERIRAENPRVSPAELLTLLNRYIHLTLARHNIYATAVCAELDPYTGRLRFARAGHPPLLLKKAGGGGLHRLESTGMMLGALGDDGFECQEETWTLERGDTVLALTDGTFEAMDRSGAQFGLGGVERLLQATMAPGNWPQYITAMVQRHRGAGAGDDVLVAALTLTNLRAATARPVMAAASAP